MKFYLEMERTANQSASNFLAPLSKLIAGGCTVGVKIKNDNKNA